MRSLFAARRVRARFAPIAIAVGALALASSAASSLAQHAPPQVVAPGQPPVRPMPPHMQRLPAQRAAAAAPPHAPHAGHAAHEGHEAEAGEEEAHGAHHCPGHGPTDKPARVNLYQGLLGVDNDKALRGTPLQRVLFRYENKDDACDPHNQPPPFAANLFNFAVLVFLVGRFGRKPLAEALAKRRSSIMTEIDSATRLKEQAEARLGEYEQRLETIDDKLEVARAEYHAVAEQEKARIVDEARERQARMRRDAEFRIEQELKAARIALLNEAATGAVRAAEELLKSRLSAGDHEQLANDYLTAIASVGTVDSSSASHPTGAAS
jgi:F-type H+-transporting ATPase subunit b